MWRNDCHSFSFCKILRLFTRTKSDSITTFKRYYNALYPSAYLLHKLSNHTGDVYVDPNKDFSIAEVRANHPHLHAGGSWYPTDCRPQQRVAIIIPYRNRKQHLFVLINRLHYMLRRQQLSYRIFVVEQVCPYFLQTVVLVHHKRIVFLVGIQGTHTPQDSWSCPI